MRACGMTAFALSSQLVFCNAKYFAARGKLFPARRVASERITSISQLKHLARPRTEYEACLSYAQSTIIF
jgi:hypothetical protein